MRLFYLLLFLVPCVCMLGGCEKSTTGEEMAVAHAVPKFYASANSSDFSFKQDVLFYKKQRFSGKQYLLYSNNDTAFVKSYFNGLLEGLQKKWYPNKKLAAVRYYVSNKKEGLHEGWWDNGRKQYTYQFHNDEYQGEVKEWYSDGQLFKVFHYEKGHEEGSERLWFQDGSVRANYVIKKGRKYGLIGIKLCKNPYEKSVN